jgi:hypothetical protein
MQAHLGPVHTRPTANQIARRRVRIYPGAPVPNPKNFENKKSGLD